MKSENRESFGVESDADSSSMNRSDTMGGSGGGGRGTFARAWTQTVGFGNLARGITEGWQKNYDSEDAWTRRLMEEVHVVSKKGTEGDIPAPDGFAKEASFWRILGMSAFFGAILGFCALFFLICAEKIPKEWVHNSDMKSFSDIDFYAGKTYYIIITGGTGLLVGLLRYVSKYPETVPGIFKEINECHVSPKTAPYTVLFSAMSLAGGASLGPEQALGSLGGGLATWLVENHVEFPVESDRKMVVLCGMCAAFGALFPTPVLGVLLLYELGQPPKSFMESILTLSVGAVVAFAIYYRFAENMYLERLTSTGGVLSVGWNFELENCVTGLIIGIVSAGLCVVNVLMIGVFRQVFNRIRDRMDQRGLPGTIIAPLIGGIAVGSISYVLPLTIGDGNMTLAPIIRQTYDQVTSMNDGVTLDEPYITAHLLICSLFAKMFCIGVSMNCGFVGGFVFPLITVGAMAGAAGSLLNPHQPIGLFIGAFMAAVPAGICPMVSEEDDCCYYYRCCLCFCSVLLDLIFLIARYAILPV